MRGVETVVRRWAQHVLTGPTVNRVVTTLLRPFGPLIPSWVLLRLQVTRSVSVTYPGVGSPLTFANAEGVDPIACLLHWRGPSGWEPETTRVFLRLLKRESTVLDVGANTGLFALLAGSMHPSIEVHAFEPVPRVFSLLERNVACNGLTNVSCHSLALSDEAGDVKFYVPEGSVPVMGSLEADWRGRRGVETTVAASTLDDFVQSSVVGEIRLIKIDVEGAEGRVLRGAAETIRRHRPFIICELLPESNDRLGVFELFGAFGYEPFYLAERGPRRCGPTDPVKDDCQNYLFVPNEHLEGGGQLEGLGALTSLGLGDR